MGWTTNKMARLAETFHIFSAKKIAFVPPFAFVGKICPLILVACYSRPSHHVAYENKLAIGKYRGYSLLQFGRGGTLLIL